ncbi:MAG: hypothetical protein ACOCV2_12710 [Persicimonas sp.]
MATNKKSLTAQLRDFYADRTEREQKLLLVMMVVLPLVFVALVLGIFKRSLDDIEAQTRQHHNSLELLAEGAKDYAERQSDRDSGGLADKFTEEALQDNDVKLRSLVASKANAADVNVSSYGTDEQPLGSGDDSGPTLVEEIVDIEIRNAEHEKLLDFFEEIESSEQPVVLKRVDIRSKPNQAGEVRARVEVSTFERREEES